MSLGGHFSACHTHEGNIKPGSGFLLSTSDSQALIQELFHPPTYYLQRARDCPGRGVVKETERGPCLHAASMHMRLKRNQYEAKRSQERNVELHFFCFF